MEYRPICALLVDMAPFHHGEDENIHPVPKLANISANISAKLVIIPTVTNVSLQVGHSQEEFGREWQMVREEQQLALVSDYIFSKKHGMNVELWDVERWAGLVQV